MLVEKKNAEQWLLEDGSGVGRDKMEGLQWGN